MPLPSHAELINPSVPRGRFRAAVFDFDGTMSLIREGWAGIMARQGLELLNDQKLHDGPDELALHLLEDAMLRLSGKPTIFQMRRLSEEVQSRGGVPPDPDELLKEFFRRLFAISGQRCNDLAAARVLPSAWAVPGTHAILDNLRQRGVMLVLASGTDLAHVRKEAELLKLTHYFGPHIYAPANDSPAFTKRDVFEMILREQNMPANELIGFGDGFSETVELKRVGGVTVGLASHEAGVPGVNPMKRTLLMEWGADLIVPDYAEQESLVAWLFGE